MMQLVVSQECLEMRDIGDDLIGLPENSNQIVGPRVQRQVLRHHPHL